ncbi:MAG: molybdenum cofactor guanylyltransferase MobA [Pseudomonadales bacterium]
MIGILLCGGAGTRMGGADKPLLNWRGQPLFTRVTARLRPQVEKLVISANRNESIYAQHASVVNDQWDDDRGPLAGIASVIQHEQETANQQGQDAVYLVCPGDMPKVPADLGARLTAGRPLDEVRYAHDGQRAQPLCLVCGDRHLEDLLAYLNSGSRSAIGWLEQLGAVPVPFPDPDAFTNCNQPEDFEQ